MLGGCHAVLKVAEPVVLRLSIALYLALEEVSKLVVRAAE